MVYEYECTVCKKVVEVEQRLSDQPLTTCPACKGDLKRIISLTNSYVGKKTWKSSDVGPRRY
jgi:putative FmdB family regulatory protein